MLAAGLAAPAGAGVVSGVRAARVHPLVTWDISTTAGTGTAGYSGNGGLATSAKLNQPAAVTTDSAGNLVIADTGNSRIRVVAKSTGIYYGHSMTAQHIYTVAGTSTAGFAGDGGPATSAEMNAPTGVAVDGAGNLVIADGNNNRVRVVAVSTGTYYGQAMTAGDIYTVAGTGSLGYNGDGIPATTADLTTPVGVAVDHAGNLVIADAGNNRVRVVAVSTGIYYGLPMTAGDIYTVAGNGVIGYSGNGGPATSAKLNTPAAVAVDGAGNLVIADSGNNVIRVVAARHGTYYGQLMTAHHIYTVAGTSAAGYSGDGGPGTSAELNTPQAVAVDGAGNLVIADSGNNRVRVVAAAAGSYYGQSMTADDIYTVAGNGTAGYGGDGGPATSAELNVLRGVTATGRGGLVIADTGNNRIRTAGPPVLTSGPLSWGDNNDDQLGLTGGNQSAPVNVVPASSGPCDAAGLSTITQIAAGTWHSLALLANGEVCAWGDNNAYGQLGDGTITNTVTPTPVCAAYSTSSSCTPLQDVTAIAAGGFYSMAIVSTISLQSSVTLTNAVLSWGAGIEGELGTGPAQTASDVPQVVCATETLTGAATGAACPDGSPATAFLSGASAIATGVYSSLALVGGTPLSWGDNTACELGVGDYCTENGSLGTGGPFTGGCSTSPSSSPTNCSVDPIDVLTAAGTHPPLSGVTAISSGGNQDMALLSNGEVMTWGDNNVGELGDGTSGTSSPDTCYDNNSSVNASLGCGWYPGPVLGNSSNCGTAGHDLKGVRTISAGSDDDLALLTSTLVCAWGGNGDGELGDQSTTNSDLPVVVRAPANPSIPMKTRAISAGLGGGNMAIDTVPQVVTWGNDADGELGNDTIGTNSDIPVRVCTTAFPCPHGPYLTTPTLIAAGGFHDLAYP